MLVGPIAFCVWLDAGLLLAAGLAPAAGLTFLCFAKEKISKRKASQGPCPCGEPCATRATRGRAQTRYAQTSARPDPVAAALLSTAYGLGSPRVLVRCARGRIRAKHLPLDYDCHVPQCRPADPQRNAPNQHLSPAQKKQIGVQTPLHPGGGEGAGEAGDKQAQGTIPP